MADAYYNEWEKYPAAWLENLAARGLIPPGPVDTRSIADVKPEDVSGASEVHFFAGIGGWPLALRLAGWPEGRSVWSGSCPCQPFSNAGKRAGTDDKRHLWPEMLRLIRECRPPTVFGEQVASKLGREWLAGVRADLEALGYAVGAADLCAAGVGAPHIRQRLFWVATQGLDDPTSARHKPPRGGQPEEPQRGERLFGVGRDAVRLADASGQGQGWRGVRGPREGQGAGLGPARERFAGLRAVGWVADAEGERPGEARAYFGGPAKRTPWFDAEWHHCLDGKYRRVPLEPELFPLAHGVPGRVGQLRAYGNAIVPQVAARFVIAFLESEFVL